LESKAVNILLTGGAGYIGSHTATVLALAGHDVVLYDNLSNSSVVIFERVKHIAGQRLRFVKGDVRDTNLLEKTLASFRVDAVMHFAGLKAVGESVHKPIEYSANNVQGTISLLQAMQSQKIKKLVFSSSATVYGEPRYLPLDENHPTSATNPYGRSKLHIEEILSDVAKSDPDWSIVCLRYFNPVGAHPSGLIGERAELSVFGADYPTIDGTGVRDYIHVTDLADGHAAALKYLNQTTGWHAVNLGTGKGYSVLQMVKAFERASGHAVPFRVVDRRAGDVAACFADPQRAKKLFDWTAKRSLEEMCASSWFFQHSVIS
jgi:UDP-glucose 4-epimerase